MHKLDLLLRRPSTFRIMKVLLERRGEYLSKYAIAKLAELDKVSNALSLLEELGWVRALDQRGIRKYAANLENPEVGALDRFFRDLKYYGDAS